MLLACFVTYRGSEVNSVAVVEGTSQCADQDAQAGLLQDVDVVVVGVPHCPTTGVTSSLLRFLLVHVLTVSIGPLVVSLGLCDLNTQHRNPVSHKALITQSQ